MISLLLRKVWHPNNMDARRRRKVSTGDKTAQFTHFAVAGMLNALAALRPFRDDPPENIRSWKASRGFPAAIASSRAGATIAKPCECAHTRSAPRQSAVVRMGMTAARSGNVE
jgi:hypothetical protein